MQVIGDLHLHSKYSRACSDKIELVNLEKYATIKGIDLLGTGDFTHPKWITHLKDNLREDGSGILRTRSGFPFILSTEISLIYSQAGKGRKVHTLIWAKDFEVADQITQELTRHGRVDYDGRPIFGMSCPELTETMKEIDASIEIIPAHIWTPWFSLFGSKSGFDSIKECFQDQTRHIHALETGLSSDPEMNFRLSQLDDYALVSFSDAHSFWPWRLGREATVFSLPKLSYDAITKALKEKQVKETIEVDPAYGKYHFDGHRKCNVSMAPSAAREHNNLCPSCGKTLTIGVEHRVEDLADREPGYRPPKSSEYRHLLPLAELISSIFDTGLATQKMWKEYYSLINQIGSEMKVLLDASREELLSCTAEPLAEAILLNRNQEIKVIPGYDGVYGKAMLGASKQSLPAPEPKGDKQLGLGNYF